MENTSIRTAGRQNQISARGVASDTAYTIAPVQAGNFAALAPEFGRTADVYRVFGIKRGTLYNLLSLGKIKGCLLRVRGQKSGVRLFDMASVRAFIRGQMQEVAL
jgi:hypothetical protein